MPNFDHPFGVTVDTSGDLFIADMGNNRIREVLASGPDAGQIITVAGDAAAGYSGDNGPATCAELDHPFGVTVDTSGDLFIADTYNCRIREVLARGPRQGEIITVAAYNGPATIADLNVPDGVAVDASGNLFIPNPGNDCLCELLANGPKQGQITSVDGIDGPTGVAVDGSGDVFIGQLSGNVVREVLASGPNAGQVVTVAGDGTPGYSGDNGPATAPNSTFPSAWRRTPRGTC